MLNFVRQKVPDILKIFYLKNIFLKLNFFICLENMETFNVGFVKLKKLKKVSVTQSFIIFLAVERGQM